MTTPRPVATADVTAFVAKVQAKLTAHYAQFSPPLKAPLVVSETGKRYVRLVLTEASHRSAYGFIDLTNGDILKSAGWKAPAKHARGNIFRENATAPCGPYGMVYLR